MLAQAHICVLQLFQNLGKKNLLIIFEVNIHKSYESNKFNPKRLLAFKQIDKSKFGKVFE